MFTGFWFRHDSRWWYKKNYNSSKLIKDTNTEDADESLPALPEISKYNKPEPIEENISKEVNPPVQPIKTGSIKISSGTSFNVVSSTKINDWLAKGNTVKFYTKSPIIKRKYTIPANTVLQVKLLKHISLKLPVTEDLLL